MWHSHSEASFIDAYSDGGYSLTTLRVKSSTVSSSGATPRRPMVTTVELQNTTRLKPAIRAASSTFMVPITFTLTPATGRGIRSRVSSDAVWTIRSTPWDSMARSRSPMSPMSPFTKSTEPASSRSARLRSLKAMS